MGENRISMGCGVAGMEGAVSVVLEKPAAWHAARREGIGGSDAGKIMAGDWLQLWLEKTGRAEPEDLSDNLAVQMGTWTEALNVRWFEKQTGRKVAIPLEPLIHPVYHFMRANLDGRCEDGEFEAKHVSAFSKDDEIVSRYYPQCQHILEVTGSSRIYLSVFFGNSKWQAFTVDRDDDYIHDLLEREIDFWRFIEADEPPPSVQPSAATTVSFDTMREVIMTGNNAWASHAADWLANKEPAKKYETATTELKALMEADVKKASGHGIIVSRAKNNSLTIRSEK